MTGPLRILFVFARLEDGEDERDAAMLAAWLDPALYRIDAVICFEQPGTEAQAERLEAAGIDVDRVPYRLSFEETVSHLAEKLAHYDVVISCQNVADIYPALERLHWRPALIERGHTVEHALAGPKHFTSRYAAGNEPTRNAAAASLANRAEHAALVPCAGSADAAFLVAEWQQLFAAVLAEQEPASHPRLFSSYVQGGFECSTHRRKDGTRLDLIAATGHDANVAADYAQLAGLGMTTVRDGLRWHLIEGEPGQFDWSSFTPMLEAATRSRTEVIWDLMHYGWPDDLDIWQPIFVDRFAAYAAAAAEFVKRRTGPGAFYCPINEISFHAWAAGDVAHFYPFARGRGFELKVQLARASIAAMRAIRAVDPTARFVQCEPIVHVVGDEPSERREALDVRAFQFQAWDLISGRSWPQLGGSPDLLDIIGVNYYRHNQWTLGGISIEETHPDHLPLRYLLAEVYARYGRPMLVSETGAEGEKRANWFTAIAREVAATRRSGVPVEGICLYPIIDHNDWDEDHIRPSGLLGNVPIGGRRAIHEPLARSIAEATARSRS
jgi:hypothetical protein